MEPESTEYVLAIDLGTGGPKVGLATTRGELVAYEFEPNGYRLIPGGGAEQAPDEWWAAIVTATHRLLERRITPVEKIIAIGCTAQWSGTVAVDRAGKPLMDAIIWLDSRGGRYVADLVGGFPSIEGYNLAKMLNWTRLGGSPPSLSGKDSLAHILFIKHELPEIYRQTYKFLEPKDYLNLRLTGEFAATYDSITLHFLANNRNIHNVHYEPRLFKLAGLDRKQFPDLHPAVDILGGLTAESAAELGLKEGTPVIAGTPDLHATAIGSGAVLDYQAHLYIGTSTWLSCHYPRMKSDVINKVIAEPSAIPGRYLVLNEQEMSGECLTYCLENLIYPEDAFNHGGVEADGYELLNRCAEQVPAGSEKLIFTPWLYGERTPIDNETLRGSFFNISRTTTRAHYIRAIFEGVAYNTRWLLATTENFVGRRFEEIRLVGGGAVSDFWCQVMADVLDRVILQTEGPRRTSLRGAALLTLLALGRLQVQDLPGCVKVVKAYRPNPENRPIYDELFEVFLGLYKNNRKAFAKLNSRVTNHGS